MLCIMHIHSLIIFSETISAILFEKNFSLHNLCKNFQFRLFLYTLNFCTYSHSMVFYLCMEFGRVEQGMKVESKNKTSKNSQTQVFMMSQCSAINLRNGAACLSDRSRRKLKHCTNSIK